MSITQREWDDRACAGEHAEFLQSYAWGEFQRAFGRRILRRSDPDFFFSAIFIKLFFGISYWYIPRGPFLTYTSVSPWILVIHDMARREGFAFLRFEPVLIGTDSEKESIMHEIEKNIGHGRVRQVPDVQPKTVWIIDLSKTLDQLFSALHPKTRYNVRLAERKGVSVCYAQSKEDVREACERFLILAKRTSSRHEFRLHSEKYYRIMGETLGEGNFFISIARYQGKDIAGALIAVFGDTATYLHGGSDERYKDTMASHLLHWKIMEDMKKRGMSYYDMGGVDTSSDSRHPWAGITRFKQGFGGSVYQHAGSYDLIFHPLPYRLIEWLRNIRRYKKK